MIRTSEIITLINNTAHGGRLRRLLVVLQRKTVVLTGVGGDFIFWLTLAPEADEARLARTHSEVRRFNLQVDVVRVVQFVKRRVGALVAV